MSSDLAWFLSGHSAIPWQPRSSESRSRSGSERRGIANSSCWSRNIQRRTASEQGTVFCIQGNVQNLENSVHFPFMLTLSPTDRVFILAGAGVSAESGIPTFRSVGGLWRDFRIDKVASPEAWNRDPRLVWEFYSMRRRIATAAKPNPAHFAFARLEDALEDRLFVCTQNVDNLHEQAGSRNVVHMHGELFKSRCDSCSRGPFNDTNLYEPPAAVPGCECGGRIRPHICWFGEVPFELDRIHEALDACTLFVAAGTSGAVEPAASFVVRVTGRARTVYVGPESPRNVHSFTECYLGNAGEVLPNLFVTL